MRLVCGFLLLGVLLDSDLDELDPNPLSCTTLVNLESDSLAERQSVIVASGPHEPSVMCSVARAPAFIQFESEDKLTGKERVTGFRFSWFVSCWGQSSARHAFHSKTWRELSVIRLVRCVKPNKLGTV